MIIQKRFKRFTWNQCSNFSRCGRAMMLSTILVLSISAICGAQAYFPYLNQRSVYLDHLLMPGAWWANPALISHIHEMVVSTSNVLPIGNRLLISDERFILPIGEHISLGIGILGAGDYRTGSSTSLFSNDGFDVRSTFAFQRPRFQIGAAGILPIIGSIGILGTFGSELADERGSTRASAGFGCGWLSPPLGIPMQLSSSWMFIKHNVILAWEVSGKLGIRFITRDSTVSACAEYTFSPSEGGFGVLNPSGAIYDAAKALVAVRVFDCWAAMAGVSYDLDFRYNNGTCVHLGFENQAATRAFFFGGYDVGIRFSADWIVLHHLWVGIYLGRITRAS
jgi:hypothetical protein